jgi:hypothetical protein
MKKLLSLPLLIITCFCFAQDAKEIIGNSIKIGSLEIAQFDFPKEMKWEDALKACNDLGEGWRLPTMRELDTLLGFRTSLEKIIINNFGQSQSYWSSDRWSQNSFQSAGVKSSEKNPSDFWGDEPKRDIEGLYDVRAVRSISLDSNSKNRFADIGNYMFVTPSIIIGKSKIIGNLEIAQYDFPFLLRDYQGKEACYILGEGWRLPSKEELKILYQNRNKIGGFEGIYYLSSSPSPFLTWIFCFEDGKLKNDIRTDFSVRAVRSITQGSNLIKNNISKPIIIDKLEIAQNDFPYKMNWMQAKMAVYSLGNGWRLPTMKELEILYLNKTKIGRYSDLEYWSAEDDPIDSYRAFSSKLSSYFISSGRKDDSHYVRAVRFINYESISIKIGTLEIAVQDFPNKMNLENATKACSNLGEGWRLPTINELKTLFLNKDKIGVIFDGEYLSSTVGPVFRLNSPISGPIESTNLCLELFNGREREYSSYNKYNIRAVRTIK